MHEKGSDSRVELVEEGWDLCSYSSDSRLWNVSSYPGYGEVVGSLNCSFARSHVDCGGGGWMDGWEAETVQAFQLWRERSKESGAQRSKGELKLDAGFGQRGVVVKKGQIYYK